MNRCRGQKIFRSSSSPNVWIRPGKEEYVPKNVGVFSWNINATRSVRARLRVTSVWHAIYNSGGYWSLPGGRRTVGGKWQGGSSVDRGGASDRKVGRYIITCMCVYIADILCIYIYAVRTERLRTGSRDLPRGSRLSFLFYIIRS